MGKLIKRRHFVLAVVALIVVAGGFVGYRWWQWAEVHESTDDAYAQVTISVVSPRVAGRVSEVLVEDNQQVQKGDVLVRLDPSDYQLAVDQASDAVKVAESQLRAGKTNVSVQQDQTAASIQEAEAQMRALEKTIASVRAAIDQKKEQVNAAEATMEKARKDLDRFKLLLQKGSTSEQRVDDLSMDYQVTAADYRLAKAGLTAEMDHLASLEHQMEEVKARISKAETGHLSTKVRTYESRSIEAGLNRNRTQLQQAMLNLSYTVIKAPISGFISRKNVQTGNYVQPGSPLMAIVPLKSIWVQANFKEDQLDAIRIGQPATFTADAYPEHVYHGHVDSISSGTGDAFSLLPPENATGNWVKVTRRVPVKIVLDDQPSDEYPLRVGLSLNVTVDTHTRAGARLLSRSADDQELTTSVQRSTDGTN